MYHKMTIYSCVKIIVSQKVSLKHWERKVEIIILFQESILLILKIVYKTERSVPRISVNNVSNSQLQDSNVNKRQAAQLSNNIMIGRDDSTNSSSASAHTPWTVVKNKRTRNIMTGQKKNVAGNFKAVQ